MEELKVDKIKPKVNQAGYDFQHEKRWDNWKPVYGYVRDPCTGKIDHSKPTFLPESHYIEQKGEYAMRFIENFFARMKDKQVEERVKRLKNQLGKLSLQKFTTKSHSSVNAQAEKQF